MNGSGQARTLVDGWPDGGLVVGVLPDLSAPEWSGRAVLELTAAASRDRRSVLVLDLAPETSDLASRFDAAEDPGFAEVAAGQVEIWEIIHRDDDRGAFFLPCGLRTSGAELARTRSVRALAERIRPRDGILLALLDRHGAGAAASEGWVDGFVRLGERDPGEPRLPGDVPELGRLEPSGDSDERDEESEERVDPSRIVSEALWLRPPDPESLQTAGRGGTAEDGPESADAPERSRVELSRRRDPARPWLRRAGRGVVVLAVLAGLGFGGFLMLGESGASAIEEVGATATAETPLPTVLRRERSVTPSLPFTDSVSARPRTEARSRPPSPGIGPLPDPGSATSAAARRFYAVADSVARGIRRYRRREERFRAGSVGCFPLRSARDAADRLYLRLSLRLRALPVPPDSVARSAYRDLGRAIEAVDRSFLQTVCGDPGTGTG